MDFKCAERYAEKISFADKAVKIVASGNSIRYAFGVFQSSELDIALAKRISELRNVKIYPDNDSFWHYDVHRVDPRGAHFYFENISFTRQIWESQSLSKAGYNLIPGFIFMAIVSPMDKDGFFWFPSGISRQKFQWEIEHAEYIIVEVNENVSNLDTTCNSIHINQVHRVVPSRNAPLINTHFVFGILPYVNRNQLLTNPA